MGDETVEKAGEEALNAAGLEAAQAEGGDVEELQKRVDAERKKAEDYLSRLKYLQADFENYRKRMDREVRDTEDYSVTKIVIRLLPVLDELELAIATASKSGGAAPVLEGVKMVRKNLASVLEAEGLKRIDAIGKPFDPSMHEAVEKVETEGAGSDRVVGVIREGYTLKGKVLRPSLVKVETGQKHQGHIGGEKGEDERA